MFDSIFFQISILLGVTAIIAGIVRALKQPLLIAYIIAGLLAGPLLLNFIHGREESYEVFSEFGIVLLLFVVGLSLNFNYIKKIGKVAIITGVGQVILTALASMVLLQLLGLPLLPSIYLSVAITFSSTIIITKLLSDKKDMESVYGRYTIGLMLIQDVIAIGILILLNASQQEAGISVWNALGFFAVKGVVIVACIYFLAKFLLPLLLERIAASSEFLFLFTLAWCFGVASIVSLFGFSLEVGAIIAGLSLGSSPYQPEISSRIRPLRDFFLIMFFIILGSKMNLSNLEAALVPGIILSSFVLLAKPFILYVIFRAMKFTRRNSFLAGLTAAQVSEFGFILLFAGQQAGYVNEQTLAIFTVVALITIFVSSYLITYNEHMYKGLIPVFSFMGPDLYQQIEDDVPIYDAWVVGYHRMGWKICEALKERGMSFAVIDYNPETAKKLKEDGIPVYFGDVADVEFLSELPLGQADLIISTIPEADDQFTFIKHIRMQSKKPFLIANLNQTQYVKDFYAAGVDYIMMPHMLGGYRIAEILMSKKIDRNFFKKLQREQEKEMTMRFFARTHD